MGPFAVLEYMKGGQMVTHPYAPLSRIEFFIRCPSPSPSRTHRRCLPPLLQFLMNHRWQLSRVRSPGTPQRSPPRAAAWGQLTMEHFFARPRPASEDEEEDDEPPTKYRCVEATTASNSTAVAMDYTNVKSTRRCTKAEVAAAPLRCFRSAHEKVEIINYARQHGLRRAAKKYHVKSPKNIGEWEDQEEALKKMAHMMGGRRFTRGSPLNIIKLRAPFGNGSSGAVAAKFWSQRR